MERPRREGRRDGEAASGLKTIIVPASYGGGVTGLASERFRCRWLAPYMGADIYDGTQELRDYEAVIWQKVFRPDLAAQCNGAVQVFDDTDTILRHDPPEAVAAFLDTMTFVTVSSDELAQEYANRLRVPVHTVRDGHDLSLYEPRRRHRNGEPACVWFGYADNFPQSARKLAEKRPLTVISERPVGVGKWVRYDEATFHDDLRGFDVAYCPPIPLKSDNKRATAWSLGLAVARSEEELELLQRKNARERQLERIDIDQFHVRHSASRMRRLIETRGAKPSVLISVHCHPPWIHKQVVFSLLRMMPDRRFQTRAVMPSHRPFENSLHHVVKDWIERSREDYWLTIDADNPPLKNPLDLLAYEKDIIGLPTPVWHCAGKKGERPYYWNAYDYVPSEDAYREHPPAIGLRRVDAVGTGCMLVSRRVFEDAGMRKGPFLRTNHEDGRVEKGNDLAFCERARARGFEVWTHYEYPCRHFQEVDLNEMIEAFGALR